MNGQKIIMFTLKLRQDLGKECVQQILSVYHIVSHCVNEKESFSAFADFKTAFDFVIHVRDALWYKLIQMGVRGNTSYYKSFVQ